ncbi:hypothetical protein SDC9_195447 [bioreactor metagenome]|uniref:Hcy-binding domain-containing protein n=1 Tax=bioreactor metagenome TaxID=1076179 RepID=A0A645IKJ2_9ZZZZ
MAKAMESTELPYIISFMIRDDGRLIDGTTINDAILHMDNATIKKPICYMVNCVHPVILKKSLSYSFNKTKLVKERFHGIQANTSPLSPEELDNSTDLKFSDSVSLADDMMDLYKYFVPKILQFLNNISSFQNKTSSGFILHPRRPLYNNRARGIINLLFLTILITPFTVCQLMVYYT